MTNKINRGIFNSLIRPETILETSNSYTTEASKDDEKKSDSKDDSSKKKNKPTHYDPEYERTMGFAKAHYADYEDEQMAFNKYVQRNLMHIKKDNRTQTNQIRNIEKSIETLKARLAALQSDEAPRVTFEGMLPKSAFAGSKKNKLGPAAHLKGKMKRAAKSGDLVGGMEEDWQKVNKKDKTDGMSSKAVKAYRRENPGSKLKTAVTTKPSKLKKGSKPAKRRASFCARMSGMKKARASAKTKRDPNSPINKALRRWNCEDTNNKQVPLSEDIENLMGALIEQIIKNETIQNHNRKS